MLLSTKFFIPQPHVANLGRPRLLAKLHAGLTSRLLLLAAPAGFGKTTLVTDWLHELQQGTMQESQPGVRVRYRVGWLSLGEEDNTPTQFLTYLIAALQRINPMLGADAQALLTTPQPPSTTQVITVLINDIAQVEQPFVLVLDDYHLITTQAIHDAISFLIEKLPPAMRLVITTRTDPPLPLARWRARRLMTEIRTQDLRFTSLEAQAFLQEQLGMELTPRAITALETRTEGWIAGLQLAVLSLQGRTDVTAFLDSFTGSHTYIIDYLVEEVLQRQPPEVEHFLLATALLDRLCAPLCSAVTGVANAQELIEQIERANLFLFALDQERHWYRYHHLFADVLRARLLSTNRPAALANHRRASQWYADAGLAEEAIHHAFASGDLAYAAAQCAAVVATQIRRGQHGIVTNWLAKLPAAQILPHPPLALGHAYLLISRHELDAAESWLRQVAEQFAQQPPTAHAWGEFYYLQALLASRRYAFPRVIEVGRAALPQLSPDDWEHRGKLVLILGVAYYHQPDLLAAQHAFAEATDYSLRADDLHTALYGISNQAVTALQLGELQRAHTAYTQGLQLVAAHGLTQLPVAQMLHGDLINLLYERDERARLAYHAAQLAQLGAANPNPVRALHNQLALALAGAVEGDVAAAIANLTQALADYRRHDLPIENSANAIRHLVAFWLSTGDLTSAGAWAEQTDLIATGPLTVARENEYLALAQLWLAQGAYGQASALLNRLAESAEREGRQRVLIEIGALQVAAKMAAGETSAALAQLQELLTQSLDEGYIRSLTVAGAALAQALHLLQPTLRQAANRAADTQALLTYSERLLAAFPQGTPPPATRPVEISQPALSPPTPPPIPPVSAGATGLIEPLSVREREVLQLVAAGYSNRQIADQLIVTVGTVKRHLNNIFGKLGVNSRTQALAHARTLGLLP